MQTRGHLSLHGTSPQLKIVEDSGVGLGSTASAPNVSCLHGGAIAYPNILLSQVSQFKCKGKLGP